jgi:hypothetical protein
MDIKMLINRKSVSFIIVAFCLLLSVPKANGLRYWGQKPRPLGEPPRVEFPSDGISRLEREHFLDADFTVITKVKTLPNPVLELFTEKGGSRLLMADPGDKFEATDFISDSSVPQMRLIFGGFLGEKCFVHYEQGGRSHMYVLALFTVTTSRAVKPRWRGYCVVPSSNFRKLRSQLVSGDCR